MNMQPRASRGWKRSPGMSMQPVPGIMDLIPWGPSPPPHHQDAFDLNPDIWSHLPENLLHSVLEWLPFQSVLRFRCVCKQWKAMFASPAFHHFASHRAHVPPLIFFIGSSTSPDDDNENSDAFNHYDDVYDDNGYVYEDDKGYADGDSHCDDHFMRDVDVEDNDLSNGRVNDQEALEEHTHIEALLLIFDCESESWRRPLALPPGFRMTSPCSFLSPHNVCTFQEQIMIPTFSTYRLFLFNPASPPCKVLPPCIAILNLEAFGFVEERDIPPGVITSSNLSNLFSMSNEKDPPVQDKTAKILQVVAVGDTVHDTNIVESFDSVTGSWHVIGRLPQSDDFIFAHRRMMYCKGCFYALLSGGMLMMSNVMVGQNMEWKFREFPDPPNQDGGLSIDMVDQKFVATRESVFLVGVTTTGFPNTFQHEYLELLIWQFHPHAPADACWELHAYVPRRMWRTFIGDIDIDTIDYLAHGDLIFFKFPGRQRFLIYDVPRKLWRLSAKCKYLLDTMTFVWEPLLRH